MEEWRYEFEKLDIVELLHADNVSATHVLIDFLDKLMKKVKE